MQHFHNNDNFYKPFHVNNSYFQFGMNPNNTSSKNADYVLKLTHLMLQIIFLLQGNQKALAKQPDFSYPNYIWK